MNKCGYFDCQKTLICIENKSYNCPLLELFKKIALHLIELNEIKIK